MPGFARRSLAVLAGIGFTLFLFALPLLEHGPPESRERLPEHAPGSGTPFHGSVES